MAKVSLEALITIIYIMTKKNENNTFPGSIRCKCVLGSPSSEILGPRV